MIAEPGRYLVADAGVLRTEVVLVARKASPRTSSAGSISTSAVRRPGRDDGRGDPLPPVARRTTAAPTGPVVIAGPTCDSADVLYEQTPYHLPLALAEGDMVDLLSAGAYTTTYSVAFNGFPPLRVVCL